jgi:exo-beta-1,3-glucanase (GH17 family)
MCRKHFEAMAAYIRRMRAHATDCNSLNVCAEACEQMCIELGVQFNERFDARRFREACQVGPSSQPNS